MREKQQAISMIESFSNAFGPSGFEDDVLEVAKQYAGDITHVSDDTLRNVYLEPKEPIGQGPLFMLDAHCDEVGFVVQFIKPNGIIRFLPIGGWSVNTLSSSKVLIRNRKGELISGIIAAKPLHFMAAGERGKTLTIEDLYIDIGACSAEEVKESFGIRVGDPIVSDVTFTYDEERDIMMGKGFDCRIGCAALVETLRRLQGKSPQVQVTGVLSSQEEVGERGVQVAVNRIKPQVAICFEGCPADDTFTEPYAIQTALKKGPMLRFLDNSIICNPRYMRYCLDLAESKGIPVQASVRSGGGNNGAIINLAGQGIPVVVVGIPVRYIHSHYGIASYSDFDAAVRLAEAVILDLDTEKLALF